MQSPHAQTFLTPGRVVVVKSLSVSCYYFFVCSWCSLALSYFCSLSPPLIFGENCSSCLLKRRYSSAMGKCGSFHEVSCLRGIRMTSIF